MSKLKQKGSRWNIVINNKLSDKTIDWINSKGGSGSNVLNTIEQLLDSKIIQIDYNSATEKYDSAIDRGESVIFAKNRIIHFYRSGLISPGSSRNISYEEAIEHKTEDKCVNPSKYSSGVEQIRDSDRSVEFDFSNETPEEFLERFDSMKHK